MTNEEEEMTSVAWWIGYEGAVSYIPREHVLHTSQPAEPSVEEKQRVHKFLYYRAADGSFLLLAGGFMIMSHEALFQTACLVMEVESFGNLEGAGTVDCHTGRILEWSSRGYCLETPSALKPEILRALGIRS